MLTPLLRKSSFFFFIVLATVAEARPPKLVVLLIGDQVRADYVERYQRYLGPAGVRHFREEGAYFTQARLDHAVTKTSPGHVLLGSGLTPSQSGIVNNEWYMPALDRRVSAAESVPGGLRVQLRWFAGRSFAQRLHAVYPKSRIVGVSLKDRGALLAGGPDQDEAYWLEMKELAWVAYHPTPPWLATFNASLKTRIAHTPGWDLLVSITPEELTSFAQWARLTEPHTLDQWDLGVQFPHPIRSAKAFFLSPFSDELVEAMAEQTLDQWHLGRNPDGQPDILVVSFSAMDLVGHRYGPDALETMDAFLRLDRCIERLMTFVQQSVGQEVVWVFSSDHGVTPFPEVSQSKGLSAGRVQFAPARLAHGNLIKTVELPWIYLDSKAIHQAHLRKKKALTLLKNEIEQVEGVEAVYTEEEILKDLVPVSVRRSYYPVRREEDRRVGELYVVLKPFYIFQDQYGTTHGQPTEDDQHVPLGFYGPQVRPGVTKDLISAGALAPTLLQLLQIPSEGLEKPLAVFN